MPIRQYNDFILTADNVAANNKGETSFTVQLFAAPDGFATTSSSFDEYFIQSPETVSQNVDQSMSID